MSIYKKLREATRKLSGGNYKPPKGTKRMSQEDIEKSRQVGAGTRMSDEEYHSLGGDQNDNPSNPDYQRKKKK